MSGETKLPLYAVIVTNLNSLQSTTTNKQGVFFITANQGDSLSFTLSGYHIILLEAIAGNETIAELWPITYKLPVYTVPNLTPYQRDSIEMATLYNKELNKKPVKPSISFDNGIVVSGLIGSAVQKMSRSYKNSKRFKKNFKNDAEQKFIDTRYTPALVGSLTGLTGDTLALFINTHPMEYKFARLATDLELKAWVRDVFKDYLKARSFQEKSH